MAMSPNIHKPTLDFLAAMQETCTCDADVDTMMDGIADTIGDMLGHQSDHRDVTEHFVARLRAAVDAAVVSQQEAAQ